LTQRLRSLEQQNVTIRPTFGAAAASSPMIPISFSSPGGRSQPETSSLLLREAAATPTTPQTSLLDTSEDDDADSVTPDDSVGKTTDCELASFLSATTAAVMESRTRDVPGAAGFLEMEEDPSVVTTTTTARTHYLEEQQQPQQSTTSTTAYEQPIRTASGLLLTHRRPPVQQLYHQQQQQQKQYKSPPVFRHSGAAGSAAASFNLEQQQQQYYPGTTSKAYRPPPHHRSSSNNDFWQGSSRLLEQPTRLLRYVRLWVLMSAVTILLGTALLVHHTRHAEHPPESVVEKQQAANNNKNNIGQLQPIEIDASSTSGGPDKIVLLPLPMMEQQQQQQHGGGEGLVHVRRAPTSNNVHHRRLESPRQSVAAATTAANETYPQPLLGMHLPELPLLSTITTTTKTTTVMEDLRDDFEAWVSKHNKKYHSHAEKQKRFHIWSENHHRTKAKNKRHGPCKLTGKTVFGSNHFQDLDPTEFRDQYLNAARLERKPMPLGHVPPEPLHPHQIPPKRHASVHQRVLEQQQQQRRRKLTQNCQWYNVSCLLRYIFETYFYGFGRTMEPAYDANSYPTCECLWRTILFRLGEIR